MPFYAVGAATADSLSSISSSSHPLLCPKDIRGAAESGTAELLAHFILSDLDTSAPGTKLLYLTGDKNRETLPSILKSSGVELMGLQVYATQGSKTFRTDLEEALRRVPDSRCHIPSFVLFLRTLTSFEQPPHLGGSRSSRPLLLPMSCLFCAHISSCRLRLVQAETLKAAQGRNLLG